MSREKLRSLTTGFSLIGFQFLLRSLDNDLCFDLDRLGAFLFACFFSRDFELALLGLLVRERLRFLERLRDLLACFFSFSFLLSRERDLCLRDSERRRRRGDRERLRRVAGDFERRRDTERFFDSERCRGDAVRFRLIRDNDRRRETDLRPFDNDLRSLDQDLRTRERERDLERILE